MAIIRNLSIFNVKHHEDNLVFYPRNDYYRFRLSNKEKFQVLTNKEHLKKIHDLKLSDVVRYFAVNYATNKIILYEMGLLDFNQRLIDFRLKKRD